MSTKYVTLALPPQAVHVVLDALQKRPIEEAADTFFYIKNEALKQLGIAPAPAAEGGKTAEAPAPAEVKQPAGKIVRKGLRK